MVVREYRRFTPEEKERLSRRACPHCGRERIHFNPVYGNTICCQPSCSMEYWIKERPTIAGMRQRVYDEQEGKCARCRHGVYEFNATRGPYTHHHYVLDHIRPIAMGGDQWARDNLQVLCRRCNRIKTARDRGKIALWKKYQGRGLGLLAGNLRQVLLF